MASTIEAECAAAEKRPEADEARWESRKRSFSRDGTSAEFPGTRAAKLVEERFTKA